MYNAYSRSQCYILWHSENKIKKKKPTTTSPYNNAGVIYNPCYVYSNSSMNNSFIFVNIEQHSYQYLKPKREIDEWQDLLFWLRREIGFWLKVQIILIQEMGNQIFVLPLCYYFIQHFFYKIRKVFESFKSLQILIRNYQNASLHIK